MSIKPFEIIFNDEYLIAINKIAKLLVEPSPHKEKLTLTSLLAGHIREKVFPCHRLDRETTGIVLYAKNASVQECIMNQFRDGLIQKRYTAFVRGSMPHGKGVMAGDIIDKEGKRHGEKPKFAKTFYVVLKSYQGFSVVELRPVTGRTNQLRIQLAQLKCPILGERIYAFGKDFTVNFPRVALHAHLLKFVHPISHDEVSLQVRLPQDMQDFIAHAGKSIHCSRRG